MKDVLLPTVEYEGIHCGLKISRPLAAVAVVRLSGRDTGEFADFPMRELEKDLAQFDSIELFIDARAVRGATVEVSAEWALWLRTHRRQFKCISMLTGSRYIEITANFVRRFGDLESMRIFTDPGAFEESLRARVAIPDQASAL